MMPQVVIQTETESKRGWVYALQVQHSDGRVSDHTVSLAWVDHDLWSGGRLAPSRVVEAVVTYLVGHGHADDLPLTFDAARARRLVPEIDRDIKAAL